MAGIDDIDITTDLNGQASDAVPAQGTDLAQNQIPNVLPPAEKPAEPPKSLRDTLSDAFKGSEPPKADQGAEKPSEAPTAPVDGPELVKVGERYHHKDGRFASSAEIDAFTRGQAPAGDAPAPSLPQWANSLTELEKQQFSSLPAEIRQYVERTMEGVNTRGAQLDEYGMIEQVIGPRRQAWAGEGMTPAVAINQLFALSDFAGRDPGQFVMWFANQHRLDLDALLDARDQANNGQAPNPQLTGLQQEIAQLKNTINGFTEGTLQQQQARNFQLVQAFMDEKDEAGNLRRPYFNDLSNDIANHVQLIKQQQPYLPERDILQAAYDFATYSNPTIRDRIQQASNKALQDKAAAEAARARSAGVSVSGGPAADGAKSLNGANRTLRETLIAAYNENVAE